MMYDKKYPVCRSLEEYFIGARTKKREGYNIRLPGRDMHEGPYDDPENLKGTLGHEEPTGAFMSKEKAMEQISNVLGATKDLQSTTEPGIHRKGDQIFMFHDELEGVKLSVSKRNHGRVWSPSQFLDRIEKDGYSSFDSSFHSDDPSYNKWTNKEMNPPNPYDTSNLYGKEELLHE
jgi:hypothetical protein